MVSSQHRMERVSESSSEDRHGCPDDAEPAVDLLYNPVECESNGAHKRSLARTIESEIIPRLLLSHRAPSLRARYGGELPSHEDVGELARLVVQHEIATARAYVDTFISAGMSVETILIELLTPAARLLGEQWVQDLSTFADVTIGLSRLQQLLRDLCPPPTLQFGRRQILLSPAPGEQHTFGLYIVAEFFRKAAWSVRTVVSTKETDLAELVRYEHIEMVGFSVSNIGLLDPLRDAVAEVRSASQNKDLVVMIGGSPCIDLPQHASRVGHGCVCAADAREAVEYMEKHLATLDR